jgi:hypothetical protein
MDYYSASDVLKTTTFKPASRISKFVAVHVNQEVVDILAPGDSQALNTETPTSTMIMTVSVDSYISELNEVEAGK